jgi:hypothetical protein
MSLETPHRTPDALSSMAAQGLRQRVIEAAVSPLNRA